MIAQTPGNTNIKHQARLTGRFLPQYFQNSCSSASVRPILLNKSARQRGLKEIEEMRTDPWKRLILAVMQEKALLDTLGEEDDRTVAASDKVCDEVRSVESELDSLVLDILKRRLGS